MIAEKSANTQTNMIDDTSDVTTIDLPNIQAHQIVQFIDETVHSAPLCDAQILAEAELHQ